MSLKAKNKLVVGDKTFEAGIVYSNEEVEAAGADLSNFEETSEEAAPAEVKAEAVTAPTITRIVEVSTLNFDAEKNETSYKVSRYDLSSTGHRHVLSYTGDGAETVEGELNAEELVAYVQENRIAKDEVDEVVYSETQTTTDAEATDGHLE